MVNQKTTAVRLIPVIGKGVGETVEFGGLLGYAPIMPVNNFSCEAFVTEQEESRHRFIRLKTKKTAEKPAVILNGKDRCRLFYHLRK